MNANHRVNAAVQQLREMFQEDPDLALSISDACLMTGLEASVCGPILDALEDVRVVRKRADGRFTRMPTGA
jgi:hypothetical protein